MKREVIIAAFILGISVCGNISAETAGKKSLRILFVGNSYTFFGNLPQIVSIMSEDGYTKLITRKSVAGSATLSEHWRGDKGLMTREMIKDGKFDIVVLQEYGMGAIDEPDTLLKYVKLFSDLIRKNKAKPFLFCTWARENTPQQQETINAV